MIDDDDEKAPRCPAFGHLETDTGERIGVGTRQCSLWQGHRGAHRATFEVEWTEAWPEADDPDEEFDVTVDVQRKPCPGRAGTTGGATAPCSRPAAYAGLCLP